MRHFLKSALLVAGTLTLAAAVPQAARAEVPAGIAMLDPAVAMVRMAGTWSSDAGKGPIRLVAMRDGGGVRLFVQWVAAQAVVATVEVEEIAAQQLRITSINIDAGENETAVHLGLVTPDGTELGGGSTTLLIRGPGDAELQAAGN